MAVSYNRLWKILIDKNMKKTQLREASGIGPTTLAKMGRNGYVSLDVLESICNVLDCRIEDVMEFVPDAKAVE
jgi:DNA-binding Xre family transcriptional regulator